MNGPTKADLIKQCDQLTELLGRRQAEKDAAIKRADSLDTEARTIAGCVNWLDRLPKTSRYAYSTKSEVDAVAVQRVLLYLGDRYGAGIQATPVAEWNQEAAS